MIEKLYLELPSLEKLKNHPQKAPKNEAKNKKSPEVREAGVLTAKVFKKSCATR